LRKKGILNDSLLFAVARKYECAVLFRNLRDFNLLRQLDPSEEVMFYKVGTQQAPRSLSWSGLPSSRLNAEDSEGKL